MIFSIIVRKAKKCNKQLKKDDKNKKNVFQKKDILFKSGLKLSSVPLFQGAADAA